MKIDSIRLENIKLAVSLIGTSSEASRQFDINKIRFWAHQMRLLANEVENFEHG